MTRGLLFLAISVVSLGFIGIFHKLGAHWDCRPGATNVGLFFWATVLTFAFMVVTRRVRALGTFPRFLIGVASVCGFCASLAILAFQTGLPHGKIATSWLIVNLSMAVPTVLALALYKVDRARFNGVKVLGLSMILLAMLFLWRDKQIDESRTTAASSPSSLHERGESNALWLQYMLLTFLTNGLGVFGLRIMEGRGWSEKHKYNYLLVWYFSGFLLAAAVFLPRGDFPSPKEHVVTLGMALSSLIGQQCLAFALQHRLSGDVVYQVGPGGGLFFVVLVGILFFGERVTTSGAVGIFIGIAGMAVLSLAERIAQRLKASKDSERPLPEPSESEA
jgi:multidrug transporter EmrE-like cation transporter